ncbi:MAG: hypothetical protein HRU09_04335 [Oligoflexales bacterium]|nr:hypothetical protein [Oligoflexales bacterium]
MLKKSAKFVLFLILTALAYSPRVYAQSVPKPSNTKKEEPYLHKVNIEDHIERTNIYSYSKKRIKFKTKDFSSKVSKYDVFLVLNDELNAILAEVVVVKLSKRKTTAYAKKSRIAGDLKLRELVGKKIIRVADLKQVLGSLLMFRSNPVAQLGLFGHSFISSAANVATGNNLNPQVLAFGASIEAFIPKSDEISWLNWFGLRYSLSQQNEAKINIKTSKSEMEQSAVFTGDSSSTELIVQPWFEYSWIYHVSLVYGISTQTEDKITFEGGELNDEIALVLARDHTHYTLELAFNPIHNIYAGFSAKSVGSQKFTVTDSLSGQKEDGLWSATYFAFWASTTVAIGFDTKLSFRYDLTRREDITSDHAAIGSGNDQQIVDWEQKVEIGVIYAP